MDFEAMDFKLLINKSTFWPSPFLKSSGNFSLKLKHRKPVLIRIIDQRQRQTLFTKGLCSLCSALLPKRMVVVVHTHHLTYIYMYRTYIKLLLITVGYPALQSTACRRRRRRAEPRTRYKCRPETCGARAHTRVIILLIDARAAPLLLRVLLWFPRARVCFICVHHFWPPPRQR